MTPKHRPEKRCFCGACARLCVPFLNRAPFLTVAKGSMSYVRDRYPTKRIDDERRRMRIRRVDLITIIWSKLVQRRQCKKKNKRMS
jgi:hypothetical protein